MVRRHQAQRLAADDPCAIELAAAEQHQAEAMIVVQRRGEPATARMEAAVLGPAAAVAGVELPHLLLRVEGLAVGQPVLLVDGHPKRSEERRVGKAWVRTCGSRWSPYH